jgi:hypothetical protein
MKVKCKVPTKMSWNSHVPAVKTGTPGVCWKWAYRISSDGGKAERRRGRATRVGGASYAPGGNGGYIAKQFVCLNSSNPNIYFLARSIIQYRRSRSVATKLKQTGEAKI